MNRFLDAYCGAPPPPAEIWSRWNLDPFLLAGLGLVLAFYLCTARAASTRARLAFIAGWGVAAFALISPLCALSVSLFTARIGQHMILALVAAPLLALGVSRATRATPLSAAAMFACLLWFWHAPAPYAATFTSDLVYWLMHLTLLGSAVWFWRACLSATQGGGAAALALTAVQMTLLGALLTFAPAPLFAPHVLTTAPWGFTPIADQQLGGVLMWALGGMLFLTAALGVIHLWLSRLERQAPA